MDLETRFAHLLQPIRDLTKNWEVDIAAHLQDYVAEMESIVISFDNGSTTMNFAEAALLIQGSACIYSKKVEYLYALVYQTLDLLASKKKMQQATSVDAEGKDKDAMFAYQKNEIEFLSLDDLPVAKNIDLKAENDRNHNLTTGHLLAQTPLSLLKVEGADRGIPLTNRKGETVGYKADFRINSSMFHSSRALLIDPSHLSLLEQSLMRHPSSTPANFLVKAAASPEKNDNVLPEIPDDDDDVIPKLDISADDVEMGMPFDDMFDEEQPMQVEEKRALRARVIPPPLKPVKEYVDPWEPLDPHDNKGEFVKPYKKGKCFKLPSSMAKGAGKGRKRKKQPVPEKAALCPLVEFINKAYFSHASKLPSNPLNLPYHGEFEHLYYSEYKKQLDISRREKKRLAQQGKFEELAQKENEEIEEAGDYHDNDAIPEMDDGGGDNFGFDAGPEDVDEDDPLPDNRLAAQPDDIMANSQNEMITSYEELVRKHVEAYLASAAEYAQMTELSKRVQQWEDRITPILAREEKFAYFDINEYGKFVLDRLDNVQKKSEKKAKVTTFQEVVEDRQIHEVSRYFLATLQLANNYNVEVSSKGPGEEGMDSMALKLLSMKQHHENMAEYRAPSVDDNMQ